MPNGWYPVVGLDVVLVNRTEQRYPRFDWDQSWHVFWAAAFVGGHGYPPTESLRHPDTRAEQPFDELLQNIREVIADKPNHQDMQASAVYVDFKIRQGYAAGGFCVYGFSQGSVTVMRDPTLGARVPKDMAVNVEFLEMTTTAITPDAVEDLSDDPVPIEFEFTAMDGLVISSIPLHYDDHWPPGNSIDCVAIALARQRRSGDALIALWNAPAEASE